MKWLGPGAQASCSCDGRCGGGGCACVSDPGGANCKCLCNGVVDDGDLRSLALDHPKELTVTNLDLGQLAYALELLTGHEIWVRGRDVRFHVSFQQEAVPLKESIADLGLYVGHPIPARE